MIHLGRFLDNAPLAGLMLAVALGHGIGRLSWRGVAIGPAGGTVLIGLVLGWLGLDLERLYGGQIPSVTIGVFGFTLFLYSVGFEAGPRFFASFRGGAGWRYVLLGVLVPALGVATAAASSRLLGLDAGVAAGLLSGALTSAPTFAAAHEVGGSDPSLAVTFAFAYPIGLAGIVLLVQTVPRWMGDELAGDDVRPRSSRRLVPEHGTPEVTRAIRVRADEVVGRTLRELALGARTGCTVSHVRRAGRMLFPSAGLALEGDDVLLVIGRIDEIALLRDVVGPEIHDALLVEETPEPLRVRVTRKDVVGKTLAELGLGERHHVVVAAIESGDVALEPGPDVCLHRGDVVALFGRTRDLRAVSERLGSAEPSTRSTNIAVYAGGIVLGLAIAELHVTIGGLRLAPGLAGGLLAAGLLLGRFQRIGRFSAHVPLPARQLVRDLGILLFVAEAGIEAGHGLAGPPLVGAAQALAATVISVVVPVVGGAVVARRLLGLDAVDAWGGVGGAMTSGAALVIVRRQAGDRAAVSYTAAYATASVAATLAGQIIYLLM